MPCYHPLTAWRSADYSGENGGKIRMVFKKELGLLHTETQLPCGQCIGCRLDRAKQWAIRIMHETSLHENNCFVTLTYNDENLPANGSLDKTHFVKFMKRLRKRYGNGIRFFQCGEYGDNFCRPHHHALLFGYIPTDLHCVSCDKDYPLYSSEILDSIWTHGFTRTGEVTFDSACYTARYIMKKVNGPDAEKHYKGRVPEYITMSRRPGVGRLWYDKYKKDLYNYDMCVVTDSFIAKPSKYYDNLYDLENAEHMQQLKAARKEAAKRTEKDYVRLETLEKLQYLKFKKTSRNYEGEAYKY